MVLTSKNFYFPGFETQGTWPVNTLLFPRVPFLRTSVMAISVTATIVHWHQENGDVFK